MKMKMKARLPILLKKKKKKKQHPKVETTSTQESLSESDEGASSHSVEMMDDKESSSSFIGPDGTSLPRFSKEVEGSALAMFARVSSTIGKTLTDEEFGSTRNTNSLYHPGSEPRESQIVHPVVCKRDIFVRTVTPSKRKGFKKKSLYHPPTHFNEVKLNQDNENDQYSVFSALKKKETLEDHKRSKSDYYLPPSYSISSSMIFRKNNRLKIETGRIASDEPRMMRTNPDRLHNAPPEQHNGRVAKECGRPPRFTGVSVSPSSTISSLSMCTDLETPRNALKPPTPKSRLQSPTQLEDIQEFGGIITTSEENDTSEQDYTEI